MSQRSLSLSQLQKMRSLHPSLSLLCLISQVIIGCVDTTAPDFNQPGIIRDEICGDGILTRSEQCEDGNRIDGDGCSSTCMVEIDPLGGEVVAGEVVAGEVVAGEVVAGEVMAGEVMAGEVVAGEVVAGEVMAGEVMAGEMNLPVCGDLSIDAGEQCDDGNQIAGDGCSPTCQLEEPQCPLDDFEPNNIVTQAAELHTDNQLNTYTAQLCLGDRDFYQIQGCAGGHMEVLLDFDYTQVDLDLRLTEEGGRLLDSSAAALRLESVSYDLIHASTLYVEVFGYLDGEEGAYTITTSLTGCSSTPNACLGDVDCPAGQSCENGVCIDPNLACSVDTDCGPLERCENGTCVAQPPRCEFDFECAVGERCVAGECIPDPSGCQSDLECPSGLVCSQGACIQPSLTPDRFEENDDQSTATLLEAGTYDQLTITSGDDDYYGIEVCAGGDFDATITFSSLIGDLDLDLLDNTGLLLDSSTSVSGQETVSWSNRSGNAQTVYLNVYGFLGDENQYSLNFNVSGCDQPVDPQLAPDQYEENDLSQSAARLEAGSYSGLTRTSGDDDWYIVSVCEGGQIDVEILFSHAQADLNAWLYNSGVLYLDGSLSSTDNETLSASGLSAQDVYINVFGYGAAEAVYDMTITISGCEQGLEEDRLEENDTRQTGEYLRPNLYSNLTITQGDEDWVVFDVCEGGTIDIQITFSDAEGDLDMSLYGPSDNLLQSSASSSDNEAINYTNATQGQYALRVYGWSGATNRYDLEFSVSNCAPVGPASDWFEVNNTRQTATAVAPSNYLDLTITTGDEDWFEVDVCQGGTLSASIYFSDAEGDLELSLVSSADVSLDDSFSSTDDESVSYANASAGLYYLRVFGWQNAVNSYDLSISVTDCDPIGLLPDRLEENDTLQTAEILAPNLYGNLTITSGDEDWIGVDVCAGGTLEAEINFTHADGDLELVLLNANEVTLTGSYSTSDDEGVSYVNATAGRYYILIYGFLDAENTYDLTIRVSNCNAGSGNDRLEENDTLETAEILTANLYSNLVITAGDEDWVGFDVCEGGDIEVEINFLDANGDLDLVLYDQDEIELDSSTTSADREVVTYTDAAAGRYYIQVYGWLGAENIYDLTIRINGC